MIIRSAQNADTSTCAQVEELYIQCVYTQHTLIAKTTHLAGSDRPACLVGDGFEAQLNHIRVLPAEDGVSVVRR